VGEEAGDAEPVVDRDDDHLPLDRQPPGIVVAAGAADQPAAVQPDHDRSRPNWVGAGRHGDAGVEAVLGRVLAAAPYGLAARGQRFPGAAAASGSVHGAGGRGARQRSPPTGGAAQGMPWYSRTPSPSTPRTGPASVATGPPAAIGVPPAPTASPGHRAPSPIRVATKTSDLPPLRARRTRARHDLLAGRSFRQRSPPNIALDPVDVERSPLPPEPGRLIPACAILTKQNKRSNLYVRIGSGPRGAVQAAAGAPTASDTGGNDGGRRCR